MKYLALEGPIQHGKSTIANLVTANCNRAIHLESGELISEVATQLKLHLQAVDPNDIAGFNAWLEPLPKIIKSVVRVETSRDKLSFTSDDIKTNALGYVKMFDFNRHLAENPKLRETPINAETKMQFRGLLQWLGAHLSERVGEEIWFNELVQRSIDQDNLLPPDEKLDIVVLSAVRMPGDVRVVKRIGGHIVRVIRPELGEEDASDPTESSRKLIVPDTVIQNNGTLFDLETIVKQFLHDYNNNQTKSLYSAREAIR